MHSLQFRADLGKKSKSIKAIYKICIWKVLLCTFRKWYCLLCYCTYCFGDISVWNQRILLNFCWLSIFFSILIANISQMVAQTPIKHSIFWKSVMRTFRCIKLRSAQNCKNYTFLDNLQTITLKGNMETRQMTPFFPSNFSALTVCNIQFFIWK